MTYIYQRPRRPRCGTASRANGDDDSAQRRGKIARQNRAIPSTSYARRMRLKHADWPAASRKLLSPIILQLAHLSADIFG